MDTYYLIILLLSIAVIFSLIVVAYIISKTLKRIEVLESKISGNTTVAEDAEYIEDADDTGSTVISIPEIENNYINTRSTTMTCKKCGSQNVQVSAVNEARRRGFFSTLFMIFLLFIPIIGWIALYKIVRGKKSKTKTYAVCQQCGASYAV